MQTNHKLGLVGAGLAIVSPFLIHFVSTFEGTRYKAYRDVGGMLTVCEGITGAGVVANKTYTRTECDSLLKSRLEIAGKGVLSCVNVKLTQNQYDAFSDLAYNIGVGAFCRSSIVSDLNSGNYTRACDKLLLFNKAGGRVMAGLTRRREAERKVCLV